MKRTDPNYDTLEEKKMDLEVMPPGSKPPAKAKGDRFYRQKQDVAAEPGILGLISEALARGDMVALDKFLEIRREEAAATALRAFDRAISLAKGEIPTIVKNRTVSYGSGKAAYKHADLAEIERTVRPVLAKYGLSYRFRSNVTDDKIIVTCMVTHEDGHREENSLPGPADTSGSKNPIQAIGSTTTYLSRYTLMLSLGLAASDDDDAQAVSVAPALLSDEQMKELSGLLADTKSDFDKFKTRMNIKSLAELHANNFEEIKALILSTAAKRAAIEKANAEANAQRDKEKAEPPVPGGWQR